MIGDVSDLGFVRQFKSAPLNGAQASTSNPHNPTAMELRRANVDGTVVPPS